MPFFFWFDLFFLEARAENPYQNFVTPKGHFEINWPLKAEHAQVERSLDELKQRFSPRPPGGGNSSFNRGPSQTSSGGSIASSSETSSSQGIYDIPSVPHYDSYVDDTDDNIPPPPPPPPMPGIGGMSISK